MQHKNSPYEKFYKNIGKNLFWSGNWGNGTETGKKFKLYSCANFLLELLLK